MNHHQRDVDPRAVHLGDAVDHLERLVGDESVHYDRRLDSLAAHLHAVGAVLLMAFKVGYRLIQVARPAGTQVVPSSDGVALRADAVTVDAR